MDIDNIYGVQAIKYWVDCEENVIYENYKLLALCLSPLRPTGSVLVMSISLDISNLLLTKLHKWPQVCMDFRFKSEMILALAWARINVLLFGLCMVYLQLNSILL